MPKPHALRQALSHAGLLLLLGLAVAAVGCGRRERSTLQVPGEEALPPVITQPEGLLTKLPPVIRLASYNLENFKDGVNDGPRTPDVAREHGRLAADILRGIAPDILLLEEIENAEALRMLNDNLQPAFPLGYVTSLGSGDTNRIVDLNLAVLSRFPLENVTELDFGTWVGRTLPPRGLLRFEIALAPDRRLLAYVIHLKSNYGKRGPNISKRRQALQALRNDAERVMAGRPQVQWEVLVAGDTNVDPLNYTFAGDTSFQPLADWTDVWLTQPAEQVTLPRRLGNPEKDFDAVCFDRVFVNSAMTQFPWRVEELAATPLGTDTNNADSVPPQNGHVSDHYPIHWLLREASATKPAGS